MIHVQYTYGKVRLGKGGIPVGGSDNNKAWPVFQAGENPVQIISGSYRSGDASEFYKLAIAPPDFVANGTVTIAGGSQGLTILNKSLSGGLHTATDPGDPFVDVVMKTSSTKSWIIPPWHQVIVWPFSAASTNDFFVSLLGLDLVA